MFLAGVVQIFLSFLPWCWEMLARAGITSLSQIREIGSVVAYVRAKRANRGASLNLLWALESALCGQSWQCTKPCLQRISCAATVQQT